MTTTLTRPEHDPTNDHHVATSQTDEQPSHDDPGLAATTITIATVLTGLFAGFFLTYSASVVLGLAEVDDVTYVRTFQAINATIRNAVFATFFFGCVPSIAAALFAHRRSDRATVALLTTGLLLCAGVVLITFVGNVPLNDELATYVELNATTAAAARDDFESTWNLLNLARAVLAVGGLIAVASVRRLPVRR